MAGDDEGLTNKWYSPTPAWSAYNDAQLGFGRITVSDAKTLKFECVADARDYHASNTALTSRCARAPTPPPWALQVRAVRDWRRAGHVHDQEDLTSKQPAAGCSCRDTFKLY